MHAATIVARPNARSGACGYPRARTETGPDRRAQGGVPLASVTRRWQDGTSLSLLASGPLPNNPTELFDSQRSASVLDELEYEFDLVIIGSPAPLPVRDAALIAQLTTHVLLVTRLDLTRADRFDSAVAHLRAVNAQILGVVLKRSRSNAATSYGSQNDRTRVVDRSLQARLAPPVRA
jgi:Mrp family chromosome partitioning ATPase